MTCTNDLELLLDCGIFSRLDVHFAQLMGRLAKTNDRLLILASALASQRLQHGHICLDLRSLTPAEIFDAKVPEGFQLPESKSWIDALRDFPIVGNPGDYRPLILDEAGRLYLYRYWRYERQIVDFVESRLRRGALEMDEGRLKRGIERLFAGRSDYAADDSQKLAAAIAVMNPFCIVTGGPGTGKTTTLAAILALLLEQPRKTPLRIALAAPTGKAAARMEEAIQARKADLPCEPALRDSIPGRASTLHRLLGPQWLSPRFQHNAENPLPFDVVVLDEASMVPVHLLAKLMQAMPDDSRLILLGDKDQLASVEEGAAFGDLCAHAAAPANGRQILRDRIAILSTNHRSAEAPGIVALAQAVNGADIEACRTILEDGHDAGARWRDLPAESALAEALDQSAIAQRLLDLPILDDPEAMLELLSEARILCMNRSGPYGCVRLNEILRDLQENRRRLPFKGPWHKGRAVIVTENSYAMKLYNGDLGVACPNKQGELRVYFAGENGILRDWAPGRVPPHEPACAITVHKSQGSEARNILLVLSDRDSPLLTRELIYTGVTRARKSVEIWGNRAMMEAGVNRRIERQSGLRDALWGAPD